jgi:hypothetical protein
MEGSNMKKTLAMICSTLLLVSCGCTEEAPKPLSSPPAETIEKMRDAAEDAVDEMLDKAKDAAEEVGEKIGEAVDRAGEAIGDAFNEATGGNN